MHKIHLSSKGTNCVRRHTVSVREKVGSGEKDTVPIQAAAIVKLGRVHSHFEERVGNSGIPVRWYRLVTAGHCLIYIPVLVNYVLLGIRGRQKKLCVSVGPDSSILTFHEGQDSLNFAFQLPDFGLETGKIGSISCPGTDSYDR